VRRFERTGGSNKVVEKNELNEVVAVEVQAMGGKTVKELDTEGNTSKTYKYDKYGKNMLWMIDELTQTKTKFDKLGKAISDVSFEGYEIAKYYYDAQNKLEYKTDIYKNKTYFDGNGRMTKTEASEGYLLTEYNYAKDKNGNFYLSSVKDVISNELTVYKDGKPSEIKNFAGGVIKEYKWLGTKLIYVEDLEKNEITWYKDDKPTYTTFGGDLINEWIYKDGKLLATWNVREAEVTLYAYSRPEIIYNVEEKPEVSELLDILKSRGIEY